MFEYGTYGNDVNGNVYLFGPKNQLVKVTSDNGQQSTAQMAYKEIIKYPPNDKGFQIEYDIIFEDDSVQKIYIFNTKENIEVLEYKKEEELWQS